MATRKAWLHDVHGVGKGAGKGRISAEGHALLDAARIAGTVFEDDAPKATKEKTVKAPSSKVIIAPTPGLNPKDVREWAETNGVPVSARGRISAETQAAYADAVKPEDRKEAGDNGAQTWGDAAPRLFSEDQKWKSTSGQIVNERAVCSGSGFSLGWCSCPNPTAVVSPGVIESLTLVK